MKKNNFIILGAGPSGLATGYGLSKKRHKVKVYEARNVLGGLGGSEEVDGMIFDYGPHIYHTHDQDVINFWRDNFGDLLEEKEFFAKNYKDGVLYDYPLSYDAIEKFPPKIRDQVKQELTEINPENIMRAQNFKEVVVAIVGPTLQNIFFEGYSKKLWGIPTTEMSAKWAPKRIEIRKTHKSFWYNQFSAVGKYGSGAIMQRIAETIETNGGEIHKNHKVIGLEKKENKISRIIFEDQEALDVEASIIISTLPITVTCELLGHKTNLQFNAYILVYVVVKQDQVLEDEIQSVYFAHDESHFHRVTEQKKYSNTGFPDGVTLLCFEISYRVRPHLQEMSEEDLSREVFYQFCDMGFADKNDYLKGWTRKFPNINPIMTLGFEEELSKATSITTSFENLHCCGGSAEFTYGDMQVMFARAEDLVELLTSEHYKINRNLKVGAPFQFNKVVKVGNYRVGGDNPTLIIAEIGINHQGSTEIATDLIKEAKLIGCEYAKIQTYITDERISPTAKSAKYTDKTLSMEETTYEMFERLELGPESHRTLFNYANKIGMPLISTPFDEKSVDILMDYNVDAFKIASFDAFNLPLIKYIASKGLPIILSTGMCGMSEIEEALETITSQGNKNVILLHCVSSYPTDAKDVNLRAITTMQEAFKVPVGYSDHTIGSTVSKAAMSIGAHVLEKHFTLNVNYEGADHVLSAEPEEMEDIVNSRDIIFSAMGSGVKKPRSVENTSINLQRKSIFTKKLIKKGELITLDNITIKGPGHGLLPKYLDLILGKKVISDISSDEPITWDVLLDS